MPELVFKLAEPFVQSIKKLGICTLGSFDNSLPNWANA